MPWYQKLLNVAHRIQGHLTVLAFCVGAAWSVMAFIIQPRADGYIISKISDQGFATADTVKSVEEQIGVIQRQLNAVDNASQVTRSETTILNSKIDSLVKQLDKQENRQSRDMEEIRRLLIQGN